MLSRPIATTMLTGFALAMSAPSATTDGCFRHGETMEPVCAANSLERCVFAAKATGGKCETEASVPRTRQCEAERRSAHFSGKQPPRCG